MKVSNRNLDAYPLSYKDGHLHMEQIKLSDIAKEQGTPCYAYSKKYIQEAYESLTQAFASYPTSVCFAVKSNSNIAILNLFAQLGAGFDIVSQGELMRVIKAGGEPSKVVFSGVGKTEKEIKFALEAGVKCFNIESENELSRIDKVAGGLGMKAPVSFRINPDVDAGTHEKISTGKKENKFGIAYERAIPMFQKASECANIEIKGIDCHIGSQITKVEPFVIALEKLLIIVDELKKKDIHLEHIDVGGGLGIIYNDETPVSVKDYANKIIERMQGRSEKLLLEPGRFLVGNSGVLITTVEYLKHAEIKNFAVVDAAMNDLIRPTLYKAYHRIINTRETNTKDEREYDVVGPVCETGDYLGEKRSLDVAEGDLLAILSTGAYGMTMCSNYNSRLTPAEVLVEGDKYHVIRKREKYEDLIRLEIIPNINV